MTSSIHIIVQNLKKKSTWNAALFSAISLFPRPYHFLFTFFQLFSKISWFAPIQCLQTHTEPKLSFVSQNFSYTISFQKNIHKQTLNNIMIIFHSNNFHFFNIHGKVRVNLFSDILVSVVSYLKRIANFGQNIIYRFSHISRFHDLNGV